MSFSVLLDGVSLSRNKRITYLFTSKTAYRILSAYVLPKSGLEKFRFFLEKVVRFLGLYFLVFSFLGSLGF